MVSFDEIKMVVKMENVMKKYLMMGLLVSSNFINGENKLSQTQSQTQDSTTRVELFQGGIGSDKNFNFSIMIYEIIHDTNVVDRDYYMYAKKDSTNPYGFKILSDFEYDENKKSNPKYASDPNYGWVGLRTGQTCFPINGKTRSYLFDSNPSTRSYLFSSNLSDVGPLAMDVTSGLKTLMSLTNGLDTLMKSIADAAHKKVSDANQDIMKGIKEAKDKKAIELLFFVSGLDDCTDSNDDFKTAKKTIYSRKTIGDSKQPDYDYLVTIHHPTDQKHGIYGEKITSETKTMVSLVTGIVYRETGQSIIYSNKKNGIHLTDIPKDMFEAIFDRQLDVNNLTGDTLELFNFITNANTAYAKTLLDTNNTK